MDKSMQSSYNSFRQQNNLHQNDNLPSILNFQTQLTADENDEGDTYRAGVRPRI